MKTFACIASLLRKIESLVATHLRFSELEIFKGMKLFCAFHISELKVLVVAVIVR
jgi:hypothetical protein